MRYLFEGIGLRSYGVRETKFSEMSVLGCLCSGRVVGRKTELSSPQELSFLLFSPRRERLLLLEDEKKKDQRFRSLQYFLTTLWREIQKPLTPPLCKSCRHPEFPAQKR